LLIGKFDQESNCQPHWHELGLIEPSWTKKGRKREFQETRVVLHCFYIQLLLISLISSINWEVWSEVKLSSPIGL